MASFGSGAQLLGNGNEIASALQSRRMGDSVSPLSQVSTASRIGGSPAIPLPPSGIPTGSAMPSPTPNPVSTPTAPTAPKPPQTESEIIVRALIGRLKQLGQTPQF